MTNREAIDWLNEGMIAEARIPFRALSPEEESEWEMLKSGFSLEDLLPSVVEHVPFVHLYRNEDFISSCLFHK